MSSIPKEIYLDIFLRIPVKSVLACKCVCKIWYSIISNPNFVKSHLNLSIQKNNYNLMLKGYGEGSLSPIIVCSISYDKLLSLPRNDVVEFDYPFRSLGYYVEMMCSCNGLVCLRVKKMGFGKSFLCLWNPCTKEYKKLPDSPNEELDEICVCGFAYDCKIEDFKLVKVLELHRGSSSADVYTLGSNSWRSIENIPYGFLLGRKSGVLVNRGLHWLSSRIASAEVIISLDINNERFEEMQLPKEPLEKEQSFKSLGVLEGCLCVVVYDGFKLDVWIMQDYGVQESWSRHFDIMYGLIRECHFMSLIWSFKNDVVLLYAGGDLVLYDPKHASVRKPEIHSLRFFVEFQNHVESLVSLNSGTYVRR